MLSLMDTELYKSKGIQARIDSELRGAVRLQLMRNIGVIAPNQIELELGQLKLSARSKTNTLLSEAINLYESNGGRIRLFDLTFSSNSSPIARHFPFITAKAPISGGTDLVPVVFVNLYGIGQWNADNTEYSIGAYNTDLRACLEGGLIAYKLTDGRAPKVFSNPKTILPLTKIYSSLFSNVVLKVMGTRYGSDIFQEELAKFNIAKFFLMYCIENSDEQAVEEFAYKAIKAKTPLLTIKQYNENLQIDFSSLSEFLKTFGNEFFRDEINISEFSRAWMQLYGAGTLFAIEFVPYLLFFLCASMVGTTLGGSSKFALKRKELEQDGLGTLYMSLMSDIR